jgi:hypothetical protein
LAALVSPVQNIIFLTAQFFTLLVLIAQDRQSCWVACLCVLFRTCRKEANLDAV